MLDRIVHAKAGPTLSQASGSFGINRIAKQRRGSWFQGRGLGIKRGFALKASCAQGL